jgi:hypothetical protein
MIALIVPVIIEIIVLLICLWAWNDAKKCRIISSRKSRKQLRDFEYKFDL